MQIKNIDKSDPDFISFKRKYIDSKTLNKKSGIYKISALDYKYIYVGSASNLYKRFHGHLSQLIGNSHGNKYLQNIFNKHGWFSFKFEILEFCEINDLEYKEQFYIDTLNPNVNIMRVARSAFGYKHSDDSRLKMSNNMIGNKRWLGLKHSEETKFKMSIGKKSIGYMPSENARLSRCREIIQFTITGEFVKEWDCISRCNEHGFTNTGINNCLNGRSKSSGNYIWKYKDENNEDIVTTI